MKGLNKFRKRLGAIPDKVKRAAQASLDRSTAELVADQRSAVPEDEGLLKASIDNERLGNGRIGQVVLAGGETTTRPVRNGQDVTFDYALAQEFGTEDHAPQPFFYGPYRLKRRRYRARLGRAIGKAIRESGNG